MRSLVFVFYLLMAFWLLASAVLRVLLSLSTGTPLDVLPAITGAIGLIALIAVAPTVRARAAARRRVAPGRPAATRDPGPSETGAFPPE